MNKISLKFYYTALVIFILGCSAIFASSFRKSKNINVYYNHKELIIPVHEYPSITTRPIDYLQPNAILRPIKTQIDEAGEQWLYGQAGWVQKKSLSKIDLLKNAGTLQQGLLDGRYYHANKHVLREVKIALSKGIDFETIKRTLLKDSLSILIEPDTLMISLMKGSGHSREIGIFGTIMQVKKYSVSNFELKCYGYSFFPLLVNERKLFTDFYAVDMPYKNSKEKVFVLSVQVIKNGVVSFLGKDYIKITKN